MGHLGTNDFTITSHFSVAMKNMLPQSFHPYELRRLNIFLWNSDLVNESTSHGDGLQRCVLAAVLRLSSAQNLLRKNTFRIGRPLVYTLEIYPKVAKWHNDLFHCAQRQRQRTWQVLMKRGLQNMNLIKSSTNRALRHFCLNWKAAYHNGESKG